MIHIICRFAATVTVRSSAQRSTFDPPARQRPATCRLRPNIRHPDIIPRHPVPCSCRIRHPALFRPAQDIQHASAPASPSPNPRFIISRPAALGRSCRVASRRPRRPTNTTPVLPFEPRSIPPVIEPIDLRTNVSLNIDLSLSSQLSDKYYRRGLCCEPVIFIVVNLESCNWRTSNFFL